MHTHVQTLAAPLRPYALLGRVNRWLTRSCLILAVAGLLLILLAVLAQIFGRYVLNDTPTWTEALALVLVLYVTNFGAAAGVRDAGHLGMESLLALAPPALQRQLQMLIHLLVGLFGVLMTWNGAILGEQVISYMIPNLGLSEGWNYLPLVISGSLIALFSLEQLLACWQGVEVAPTWH